MNIREKIRNNRKVQNFIFIFEHVFAHISLTIMFAFFIISILETILKQDIWTLIKIRPYSYIFGGLLILYCFHIVKYIFTLRETCDLTEAHLKAIENKMELSYYEMIKCDIDILSMKISILKSFSPMPLIVLLIGFFIDNKNDEEFMNYYIVFMFAFVLFYFLSLYKSYLLYTIYRKHYHLLKIEQNKKAQQ